MAATTTRTNTPTQLSGLRIGAVGLVLVAIAVVWACAVVGWGFDLDSNETGIVTLAAIILAALVGVGGVWWIYSDTGGELPPGIRLFVVLVLDAGAIGAAIAIAWRYRAHDAHLAALGGLVGVVAVVTFFGMLWSYPSGLVAKSSVRSALAATVTLVYLTLAGILIFDTQGAQPRAVGEVASRPAPPTGEPAAGSNVLGGTEPTVDSGTPTKSPGEPPVPLPDTAGGASEPESITAVVRTTTDPDDIFSTLTWAFMSVIGFYFAATAVENISKDRTTSAAVKTDKIDGLKALREDTEAVG